MSMDNAIVTSSALRFACEGDMLVGIVERPSMPRPRGVLIVVGGPQYRVGSHRQFVLLARDLAARGFPVFRFDYRGMGDSDGEFRGFEHAGADIAAAARAFRAAVPEVKEIVLWGLCDGASAAAFHTAQEPGIAGLIVANPWVRTDQGLARSYVSHYYGRRLLQRDFWRRLLGGEMNVTGALRAFLSDLARASGADARHRRDDDLSLPERVRRAFTAFRGPVLILLSGNDLTAGEFADGLASAEWRAVLARGQVKRLDFPDADHTFSRRAAKDAVGRACADWLESW